MRKILFVLLSMAMAWGGFAPLHDAVMYGHLDEVKAHLAKEPNDVMRPTSTGLTPLHIAIKMRDVVMAEYLLSMKADIDAQDDFGISALHLAVKQKRLDLVKFLIDRGANINIANESGITPLHQAAFTGELAIVEYLVQKGANPRAKNLNDATPFDLAMAKENKDVAAFLYHAQKEK
ncbi:MAG: hypothetical protein KU37_11010 [Sulfuricurvum sp. PC08-66]|nr:MAG: hypothetical protein KU37_11010 [Sulfuricurvum sp. PC08-66]